MKKLMMFITAMLIAGGIFAGDVYALKMTCKTPVIKSGAEFYKDFASKSYQGFIDVNYNDDGSISNPCVAVVYGDFAGVKSVRVADVNFNVANICGKKMTKIEAGIDIDLDTFTVSLCGVGNCAVKKGAKDACGEVCLTGYQIAQASGNLTGYVTDVLCDPCGDKSWSWVFNSCAIDGLAEGDTDVVYGNWTIRFNKALTRDCLANGFYDAVYKKIPGIYK